MLIPDEDGYELWLRYRPVSGEHLAQYRAAIKEIVVVGTSATSDIIRREIDRAVSALLDRPVPLSRQKPDGPVLVIGTIPELATIGLVIQDHLAEDGFLIRSDSSSIMIAGQSEVAVLYGVYHFLRLLQTQQVITPIELSSAPRLQQRLLCHWDNVDGSIERGYAGQSVWQWDDLPHTIDPRYHDYARACASLGLNGTVLNNVNAQVESLSTEYLIKAAALADVFRPYGLRVYLSPLFSAPMQLGGLNTSDPRDPQVAAWWRAKVAEIYRLIPEFGGFQIKANSEGQPGPRDYGATHADGANLLAEALGSYGGHLLWRAFVYDMTTETDRAKCAYREFVPLDGQFRSNVLVQVKNGPIDFQPREPFHPLLGNMPHTPLALELQITPEYLGQSIHLVYLGGLWKEVLEADTCAQGAGSTVARVVDGSLYGHATSSIVGVANTGTDRNWCGHHFSQANWYAFGRLAWDHALSAEAIAEEWIRSTWSNQPHVIATLQTLLLNSWRACIDYMTPLGLHHLMQEGHHYGPDPGFDAAPREDWNNVYYHRADAAGLGFDRTHTGTNAVAQYHSPLREQFDDVRTCPEKFLLWFHHVPWTHRLSSGRTLWEELQQRYAAGVEEVEKMYSLWQSVQSEIDPQRYEHVRQRLIQQLENTRLWRDVCLAYFGQFAQVCSPAA